MVYNDREIYHSENCCQAVKGCDYFAEDMSQESTFRPRKELRENPLKRALQTFVVPVISLKYQTIGIRCIWTEVFH